MPWCPRDRRSLSEWRQCIRTDRAEKMGQKGSAQSQIAQPLHLLTKKEDSKIVHTKSKLTCCIRIPASVRRLGQRGSARPPSASAQLSGLLRLRSQHRVPLGTSRTGRIGFASLAGLLLQGNTSRCVRIVLYANYTKHGRSDVMVDEELPSKGIGIEPSASDDVGSSEAGIHTNNNCYCSGLNKSADQFRRENRTLRESRKIELGHQMELEDGPVLGGYILAAHHDEEPLSNDRMYQDIAMQWPHSNFIVLQCAACCCCQRVLPSAPSKPK